MFTLAIRGLAAVAASAAAIVAWFGLGHPSAVSGAPFSDVLAELRKHRWERKLTPEHLPVK